jgi:hypothetical protein
MKKVLIPKEALEKFVEIAQDNLDEKRVLRNELQRQVTKLCTLPWPSSLARQPCRNYTVLITGRRPAGLQAFLRPLSGSLLHAFPAINTTLRL